jgi:predicted  nucleic acid-binding Zn-ribbon protein
MTAWTIDFTDLKNTIDEMVSKLEDKPKAEQSSQSDLTAKYKKLYEASIDLETLKNRREALEKAIVKIDLKIEELNKLFSN